MAQGTMARARRVRLAACGALAVVLAALSWIGLANDVFEGAQIRAADSAFPRGEIDPRLAVVAIDARSVAATGMSWPWPRTMTAALVDRLFAAGARVAALDLLFSPESPADPTLAASLAAGDSVVGEVVTLGRPGARDLYPVRETIAPVEPIAEVASVGHTAVIPDPGDGLVRTVPLVVDDGRTFVPALSVAALALADGVPPVPIVRPDAVQVGRRIIPTTPKHELAVSYAPTPELISASDVLMGSVPRSAFRDKVVFVGVTDLTVGDRVFTPVDGGRGYPGVMTHVMAANTVLTEAYLAPVSDRSVVAWAFALALLVALVVQFAPLWLAAAGSLLIVGGYLALAFTRFEHGVVMNFVYPTLAMVLAIPVSGAVRYVLEVRQRRRVNRLFAEYVPEVVAETLLDEGDAGRHAAGERLEITVLFCDLRGYTAMSSGLPATVVAAAVNVYYAYATDIIFEEHGTLLQFVGDEVFAVFGAPLTRADHASAALRCARRLQEERADLLERLSREGLPELHFGIGLNSGEVVAAHMGTERRRQYTVIGDTVNVGARLCSQAASGEVVLSDAVYTQCEPRPAVVPAGALTMKGVPEGFVAWRLLIDDPTGPADAAEAPGTVPLSPGRGAPAVES